MCVTSESAPGENPMCWGRDAVNVTIQAGALRNVAQPLCFESGAIATGPGIVARVVVCGATTGANPPAALSRVWWKELTIMGSTMGSPEDFAGAYDLVASGRALPVVDEVFPLEQAAAAHERLERGEQLGKIVLRIPCV